MTTTAAVTHNPALVSDVVGVDPRMSPGVAYSIGTTVLDSDGNAYQKVGSAATAWRRLGITSSTSDALSATLDLGSDLDGELDGGYLINVYTTVPGGGHVYLYANGLGTFDWITDYSPGGAFTQEAGAANNGLRVGISVDANKPLHIQISIPYSRSGSKRAVFAGYTIWQTAGTGYPANADIKGWFIDTTTIIESLTLYSGGFSSGSFSTLERMGYR